MSPEQAQLKEIGPTSDIFSLGVVLYETLTLRKPFARATIDETVEAICRFIPPPVSEINPSVNDQVSKVVHKSMAKQPMYRFASASDLAEALNKAYRNESVFDAQKIQPRIERAKAAFKSGDDVFASEILGELEAEGNLDPQITVLRTQIDLAAKTKKVRQLLESARARMEQEEIPLALEKIREVLEHDPGNADALAMRETMEKQRNESQIAKWLELARTHLGNHDFAAARHAVEEVLAIRRGEPRALDLIEKIAAIEEDARHVRAREEELYNSALKAYQNDEIDTALSKLERLLAVARSNPDAAVPERDAVYQTFYKEVRSERDNIRSAMEEAQNHFNARNFAEALRICADGLSRHPGNGGFLALKIQVEDAERQQLSAYIAEVSKRVEAEFDLDRRANILREAGERYPNETQFAQQLKVVRERRDLVNSVVAKARQFEERGQYSDALSQWDMLRTIHPQYPGLAFDLEQCRKERDRQVREEEKSRTIRDIERLMESRFFPKAVDAANSALRDFPGDEELAGLAKLAEQGLERIKESRRLLEEGQRAFAEKNLPQAAELLRDGLKLDPRFSGLRDALVNVLTEWARVQLQSDWRTAVPLYDEVKGLDPGHPAVRALGSSLAEAKRQAAVSRCLADARVLVAAGNARAAYDIVTTARADYPNDPRLEQFEAALVRDNIELQGLAPARATAESVVRVPPKPEAPIPVENSPPAAAKTPAETAIERTVSEVRVAIASNASAKQDVNNLRQFEATKVFPVVAEEKAAPKKATQPEAKIAKKKKENPLAPQVRAARAAVLNFVRPGGRWAYRKLGGVAAGIVVIAAVAYWASHRTQQQVSTPVTPENGPVQVEIATAPPDATVVVDSKPIAANKVLVPSGATLTAEVSRLGYKTKAVRLTGEPRQAIKLDPEPLHLSVETVEKDGAVELDGQKIGVLLNGALEGYELPSDGNSHTLSVLARGKTRFTVAFQALPGAAPRLSPLAVDDFFAVSGLGGSATLYGGKLLTNIRLDDRKIPNAPNSGIELPPLTESVHELKYGPAGEEGSVALGITTAPLLVVHSVNPGEQFFITSNVETATLTLDGDTVKRQLHGWRVSKPPGLHHFALSADGYNPQTWTMTMQPHQTIRKDVALVLVAPRPTANPLVIANGTPGAEVLLDGKKVGELDSAGNGQYPLAVGAPRHDLLLRKQGFESRTINFPAPQPPAAYRVANDDAKLTQFGVLAFIGAVNNLPVKYHRAGEPEQTANSAAQVPVPAGKYEIILDAPGFNPLKTEVTVKSGQPTAVNLSSVSPIPAVDDPAQVTKEGQWFKAKDSGRFVYLKPGAVNVILVFSKPKSLPLIAKGKIQWSIVSADGKAEVQYELEEQKLSRKLELDGRTLDEKKGKANVVSASQNTLLSVHIQADRSHVRVSNDKGETLDDYTAIGYDLSKGKVGIKTNSRFAIWGNVPGESNHLQLLP